MKDTIARIRGSLFTLHCRYMRRNISIGAGLRLYCKLEILGDGTVSIGRNCVISGLPGDRRQYVTIYTHSPAAFVSIGDNVILFAARISANFDVSIDDDCLIEEAGVLDTDFHSIEPGREIRGESKERCRVRIGNRVSVGARSFICKGVTLGDDVIVCPGSIVTRNMPAQSYVCGNPARVMER